MVFPGRSNLGSSPTARAFDATVTLRMPKSVLCLVRGAGTRPDAVVAAHGGRVSTRFSESTVLAAITFEGCLALQADARIAVAGLVQFDLDRYRRFVALTGAHLIPPT